MLDRLEILSGIESPIHPELKFFNRRDAAVYALRLDLLGSKRFLGEIKEIFAIY
ncbi:MAG: hypothetical protein IPH31_04785 [Lewinellaceae bacterium]|nr:hypothetical protein [Lewinellaceae bacterium]